MFSYKKAIIICLILNFIVIEFIQTEDGIIIINNNSLHENVCMKREGCETKKYQKYQRVLISNYGYHQKMCHCSDKLSFRCGPKLCTKDMKSCINILTVYQTESLNLNKC